MFFHRDLEAGLEDLLGEIRKQAARPDQAAPIGLGLLDELLRERPIRPLRTRLVRRCRHRHIIAGHNCLSFSPSGSLSVSGQASYTADLTVPPALPDGGPPIITRAATDPIGNADLGRSSGADIVVDI